jgi:hypothetical protein
MDKKLDQFLASDLLEVPEGFAQTVMSRVHELPLPLIAELPPTADQPKEWLQWLALIGSAILGVAQLSGFIFGIWAASTVG